MPQKEPLEGEEREESQGCDNSRTPSWGLCVRVLQLFIQEWKPHWLGIVHGYDVTSKYYNYE